MCCAAVVDKKNGYKVDVRDDPLRDHILLVIIERLMSVLSAETLTLNSVDYLIWRLPSRRIIVSMNGEECRQVF